MREGRADVDSLSTPDVDRPGYCQGKRRWFVEEYTLVAVKPTMYLSHTPVLP